MSGFFLVRRSCLDLVSLYPQGFMLLLELLAHSPQATVTEVPYTSRARHSGVSKAGIKEGATYLTRVPLQRSPERLPRKSAGDPANSGATNSYFNLGNPGS
jgi:dolichol-phosphate mannosyltransferase